MKLYCPLFCLLFVKKEIVLSPFSTSLRMFSSISPSSLLASLPRYTICNLSYFPYLELFELTETGFVAEDELLPLLLVLLLLTLLLSLHPLLLILLKLKHHKHTNFMLRCNFFKGSSSQRKRENSEGIFN